MILMNSGPSSVKYKKGNISGNKLRKFKNKGTEHEFRSYSYFFIRSFRYLKFQPPQIRGIEMRANSCLLPLFCSFYL